MTRFLSTAVALLSIGLATSCSARPSEKAESRPSSTSSFTEQKTTMSENTAESGTQAAESAIPAGGTAMATFGTGCFWCTEAVFQRLEGVTSVVSGYAGGHVKNPSYKEVCTGETGHAECLQIVYDPAKISFKDLLEVFWKVHDPTTLNRQGNDIGTQYRSVIFYHNDEQKQLAEKYKKDLNTSGAYSNPIVTEISALPTFYKAEDYHQNYFNDNPGQGYCAFVVRPKVEKFESVFKDKLKKQ
jgi:peptide-methionine (S)-S-oxide reductase